MKTWLQFIFLLVIVFFLMDKCSNPPDPRLVAKVERNYGAEVKRICQENRLPCSFYFKALIILECSAEKPAKSRYEPHIYDKLKAVKSGELKTFSKITQKQLQKYSDSDLKLLATSWGALQIMGYHCIAMGISINDLRGEKSLEYGIKWCKEQYGSYLLKQNFRDAFHIHNTGKTHPLFFSQTHDSNYVTNGLAYIYML